MLELELATVEQIVAELKRRDLPFLMFAGTRPASLAGDSNKVHDFKYEDNNMTPLMAYSLLVQLASIRREYCKELGLLPPE